MTRSHKAVARRGNRGAQSRSRSDHRRRADAAVWAGQAEQFTPEFKEVRKSVDPKHTPKIVAP